MTSADFTQITVGPVPVQVCPPLGQGKTVTVYNADLTNVVTFGRSNSIQRNASNGAPIQPLTSAVLSAEKALYAVAPSGTAPIVVLPDGGSMSPSPAQIAAQIQALGLATEATQQIVKTNTADTVTTLGTPAQDPTVTGLNTGIPNNIAVTGVPLLSLATSLLNLGSTAIAANGTNNQGPLTISQIGYEIFISVSSNAGSLNPFLQVALTWTDSVTGNTVAKETWYLAGSSASPQTYMGTGPTKGDRLSISFKNLDTVNSVTVQCGFAGNSRVYVRDDWRNLASLSGVPGFTNATYDQTSNFLISTSPGVPATSSLNRLMPLYAGLVNILVIPGSGGAQVTLSAMGTPSLTTPTFYSSPLVAAAGVLNTQVNLPRALTEVTLFNPAASNQQIVFVATIAEQPA